MIVIQDLLCMSFVIFVISRSVQSLDSNDIGHVKTIFDHYSHQDASNTSSVSYALCTKTNGHSEIDCKVYITTLESMPNGNQCNLRLPNTKKLVSLKRLNDQKIILTSILSPSTANQTQSTNVKIIDMEGCRYAELHLEAGSRIITYSDSNFDVVTSECERHRHCRLSYNGRGELLGEASEPKIQLKKAQIRAANKRLYIEGRDPKTDRFKVFRVTPENKLECVFDHGPSIEVASTGQRGYYAICYLEPQARQLILCAMFDENGNRTLNTIAGLSKDVQLIAVRVLDGDAIVLFTERMNCQGEECWKIGVTKMRRDEGPETQMRSYRCSGSRTDMILDVYKNDGVSSIIYGCERESEDESESSLEFKMEDL